MYGRNGIQIGLEGDSQCALHNAFAGGGEGWSIQRNGASNRAYWQWANIENGGKFFLVGNKAYGGNTSASVLSRFYTSDGCQGLVQEGCDLIYVSAGINDFAGGMSLATYQANMIQIWDQIVGLGATPVASTILTGSGATEPYAGDYLEANAWLRQYLAGRRDVLFFDALAAWVDPTNVTAEPKATYSNDGTHCAGPGARAIGQAINTAFANLFPASAGLIASAYDSKQLNASSRQIILNPLFALGTGGTATPGGGSVTGDIAQFWNIQVESGSAAVTASLVPRADGFGNDQQIQIIAPGATSVLIRPGSSIHASVTAGDTVACQAEAWIEDHTAITEFNWYISNSPGDGQTRYNSLAADTAYPLEDFGGLFRIPHHTMGVTPTAFRPILRTTFSGSGTATVRLGRAECRLVTPNPT